MLRISTLALISVGILAPALVQTQDVAVVEGVVTRAETIEPIGGATIELSATNATPTSGAVRLIVTNDRGEFRFTDVKAGDYRLVATDPNGKYAPAEYLQRHPRGRGLVLSIVQGQNATGLHLEMTPTSSISGRILDAAGLPVGMARVFALEAVFDRGRRTLNVVQTVQSNDLGEFRLFWLLPGDYYLAARPESPQRRSVPVTINPPGYGATSEEAVSPAIVRRPLEGGGVVEEIDPIAYFGGTTDIQDARKIALPAGASISAEITLSSRVTTHRIRGRVVDSSGQAQTGASVRAIPLLENVPQVVIPFGTTNTEGIFEIAGAVPGRYSVFAVANSPFNPLTRDAVTGWTSVEVGSKDLENVTVALRPGLGITGRIQVEGRAISQVSGLKSVSIELLRNPNIFGMPAGPGPTSPLDDGVFRFDGVSAGYYRLNISSLPANAYVKEVRMGPQNLLGARFRVEDTERPVDVTLGLDGASVEGVVMNNRQSAIANATVVLVPDQPLRDRSDLYRTGTTDVQGRFSIRAVSPGIYTAMAWEYVQPGIWQDPEFLQDRLRMGTSVRLDSGTRANLRLQAGESQ